MLGLCARRDPPFCMFHVLMEKDQILVYVVTAHIDNTLYQEATKLTHSPLRQSVKPQRLRKSLFSESVKVQVLRNQPMRGQSGCAGSTGTE